MAERFSLGALIGPDPQGSKKGQASAASGAPGAKMAQTGAKAAPAAQPPGRPAVPPAPPSPQSAFVPVQGLAPASLPTPAASGLPAKGGQGAPSKVLVEAGFSQQALAELLREMGAKPSHLHIAQERARQTGEPLTVIMRDFGFISGEQAAEVLARQMGWGYFPPAQIDRIDRQLLNQLLVDQPLVYRDYRRFAPVGKDSAGRLVVAVPDAEVATVATNALHREGIVKVAASEWTIQTVFRRFFAHTEDQVRAAIDAFAAEVLHSRKRADEDESGSGHVRDVLFAIIRHACYAGASDIYFHKSQHVGIVKLKVNGVGTIFQTLHPMLYDRVLNKLVTENAKAEELRKEPKDTFIQFSAEDAQRMPDVTNRWRFRLELAETRGKRTAVVRLLDNEASATDIDKLGFDKESYQYIQDVSRTSNGFFLVTGPTGSGKTTTLYAVIKSVDAVERSVQSIENPIEYEHGLWMQYEVRKDATNEGEEYNKWLKALLRNAPDVILVGEVRDRDVAGICLNAANTGHLVFATLHTNNAVLALGRLKSLQVDLDVLASVLLGILAQRLIRVLCSDCKLPDEEERTAQAIDAAGAYLGKTRNLFKAGAGCVNCEFTGYRGRRMIYEVLRMTPEVRTAIECNEPPSSIARKGMKPEQTLWACGMRLVASGHTSMDELRRVATEL